ncbi:fatty acid desaturase-domain-containing protein [Phascolomyces articulosus]|uniref:Fatty acid desaturase-domain-containing protein n=1 Tax=Phascolomyces articulosus TaxID=60185 RepID=A0AAD5PJR4_9FUNG|nr:fatty acid desaturase-domain-containing protein [Phascolomyces articulosus]
MTSSSLSTRKKVQEKRPLNLDEAIKRGWEIPDFSIKEIRDTIPAHCFHRDTFRSFLYLFHDLFLVFILGYTATYFSTASTFPLRICLWILYWIAQGIVFSGIWVLGHECGHYAFSQSKIINNLIGSLLHYPLLTPYHSLRITHGLHHKGTGHMSKEQSFLPMTRSKIGLPPRTADPEGDGPHKMFDDTPIAVLLEMLIGFSTGLPLFILTNAGGQLYPDSWWTSHFNPYCPIFDKHQFSDVIQSIIGISTMFGFLIYLGQTLGFWTIIQFYVMPYMASNIILTVIFYLQHIHPSIPHYRENVWNFHRGAALTVDRSYGSILDHFFHHVGDTHVVHHFFSRIPHYHAIEATRYIKKALGKHYFQDETAFYIALWKIWTQCRFIEDEGDVVFYKN